MKKEIKSTTNGFVIVDEDNNIIHEYDENEAIERLLKDTQVKSLMSEWVEHNKEYVSRLNELTEDILTREEDIKSPYWMAEVAKQLETIN